MSFAQEEKTGKECLNMLQYARPHASEGEAAFVDRYIGTLPGIGYDKFGNATLQIGTAPILWSCHTDTVHHTSGRQEVAMSKLGIVTLEKPRERGFVLGADDAAGVWMMRQMVKAQVSGLYVFHAGEEHGGLGSHWLAQNRKDLLGGLKAAIAFDRKADTSIITHQGFGRCCSEDFAISLARKLNKGMSRTRWRLDHTGVFTDTANYTDLIGECTNLSIGYENEHTMDESLDLAFLLWMADTMTHFTPEDLDFKRQPGEIDWEEEEFNKYYNSPRSIIKPKTFVKDYTFVKERTYDNDDAIDVPFYDEALLEMCRDYPEIACKLINNLGASADDFLNLAWREGIEI